MEWEEPKEKCEDKFFVLQEGERIVERIKPKKSLFWYFLLTELGLKRGYERFGIEITSMLVFLFIFLYIFSTTAGLFPVFLPFYLIIIFGLIFLVAYLRYKHQYYWITNKRIIYKRGTIGYSITSIPLERISDVIISRTFLERIFGFGSILIQTLAGQSSPGRLGAEASLLAVPNPEETQQLIFELIKRKRREEKITM